MNRYLILFLADDGVNGEIIEGDTTDEVLDLFSKKKTGCIIVGVFDLEQMTWEVYHDKPINDLNLI